MTLRQLAGGISAVLSFGMAVLLAACSVAVTAGAATPGTSAAAAGTGISASTSLTSPATAGASTAGASSVGTATAASTNGSSTSSLIRRETRQVTGFHAVTFTGVGTLLIDQTGTESLTIEAEPKVLALLRSDVVNGRLLLGPRSGASFQTNQPIIFRLTVKALDDVMDDGSGRIDGSHVQAAKLSIAVQGSGAVNLNGSATVQDISVAGSGSFDGASLAGKSAQLRVTGSGQATVNASDALSVVVTGSGSVRYLGSPTITQQVSGSGSIGRAAAP